MTHLEVLFAESGNEHGYQLNTVLAKFVQLHHLNRHHIAGRLADLSTRVLGPLAVMNRERQDEGSFLSKLER